MAFIGCSVDEFKTHIADRFRPGMSWDNYGLEWQFDHIRPCTMFNLLKKEDQIKCFHYSNIQPLWKTTDIAQRNGDYISIGNINKGNYFRES